MPTLRPPRREPRVLAVARDARGLLWAVADPWEIRGAGKLRCSQRAEALQLRRVVRREKPTAVITADLALSEQLERAAVAARVPVLPLPPGFAPRRVATELYPELPLFAPRRPIERVARLAVAAVLHSPITTRRYAARRNRTAPRSA